jgi:group I intron endonuclease
MHRIYIIRNNINNKIYIGQTTMPIEKRFAYHVKPSNRCILLKKAIAKYGKENFTIHLLTIVFNKELADKLEIFYIKKFLSNKGNGYNICKGGQNPPSWKGKHHSKKTIEKLSSIRGKKHPNFGRKQSEEEKNKRRKSLTGSNNPCFGKLRSDSFKIKVSNSKLKKSIDNIANFKSGCVYKYKNGPYEVIVEFDSKKYRKKFKKKNDAEKYRINLCNFIYNYVILKNKKYIDLLNRK